MNFNVHKMLKSPKICLVATAASIATKKCIYFKVNSKTWGGQHDSISVDKKQYPRKEKENRKS